MGASDAEASLSLSVCVLSNAREIVCNFFIKNVCGNLESFLPDPCERPTLGFSSSKQPAGECAGDASGGEGGENTVEPPGFERGLDGVSITYLRVSA